MPDKYGLALRCISYLNASFPKDRDQLCVTSSKSRTCLSIQCTTRLSRRIVQFPLIICKQNCTFVLRAYKYLWREHKRALSDMSLLCSAILKYETVPENL